MKNKPRLPKKRLIHQDVTLPNPPLKTDELIDFLERSHNENVKLVSDTVHELLPVLLFVQQAIDQDDSLESLIVRLKDRNVNYCTPDNAVAEILRLFSAHFYEAWNQIDEADLTVHSALKRYREIHPKVASA
ncbi:MAG: hypothetical protein WCD04_16720 [Terriglobia bacterium]|jgi:hypothetical protein